MSTKGLRFGRWLSVLLMGFIFLCSASSVWAKQRRALIVGSHQAPPGLSTLRYAHDDARKVREVLIELGGIEESSAELLLEPNKQTLLQAFERLQKESDDVSQLFFYYSGHADDTGLRLGDETVALEKIRDFLANEKFSVRVALLDSCQSGAASRTKGGKMRPGVDIRWTVEPSIKGAVLITSSSAEEASVERDDLGGSLFTHFFVSGLRGASDSNEDGRVSLEEVFRYSYDHTLARSTDSRAGTQHPTYEYRIAGQRQLVLTWLDMPSFIGFDKQLAGSYVVFDRSRGQVVAELTKKPGVQRRLWLSEGDYFVKKRLTEAVLMQKISLTKGKGHHLREHEMYTIPFEEDVTKGRLSSAFQTNWKYGSPYRDKTALTLRRGEMSAGLRKIEYGVSDDITLYVSPLSALFLGASFGGTFKLMQKEHIVWSLNTDISQSYFRRAFSEAQRSDIRLTLGTSLSWTPMPSLILSLSAGWGLDSIADIDDYDWETQTAKFGGSATWNIGESDLLQVFANNEYTIIAPSGKDLLGTMGWSAGAFYAHRWGAFRTGIGARYSSGLANEFYVESQLTPVLDLWWRW
jgi:hypothetical protein